jgi:hypothetical protein
MGSNCLLSFVDVALEQYLFIFNYLIIQLFNYFLTFSFLMKCGIRTKQEIELSTSGDMGSNLLLSLSVTV